LTSQFQRQNRNYHWASDSKNQSSLLGVLWAQSKAKKKEGKSTNNDLQNITQKFEDRAWTQMFRKDLQFLFHMWHPSHS